jgi:hypothetical protein
MRLSLSVERVFAERQTGLCDKDPMLLEGRCASREYTNLALCGLQGWSLH